MKSDSVHILTVNSGSSSVKFGLYAMGDGEERVAEGAAERIGLPGSWLWSVDGRGNRVVDRHLDLRDHDEAVKAILMVVLEGHQLPVPDAVGHRLVHGGPDHSAPEAVTPELLLAVRALIPLAPLHLPSELRGIDAVTKHYPGLPQVACFDTAFHRGLPEVAQWFPLPRELWHEGVRRYGFHGLSYEYVVSVLGPKLAGRAIIAHLGNGASMAALHDGRPRDTTMGFSATGGLMMGTRSGDLDPGTLLYLQQEKGYGADHLERLLNTQSGLTGVSGISSDMKTLLEQRAQEPHAAQAVDLFCYVARKSVGALSAVLGGLDTLVFTGGIGERAAPVRWGICRGLEYLGVRLNPQRNEAHEDVISSEESRCTVRVVATDEDLMIARHTRSLVSPRPEGGKS